MLAEIDEHTVYLRTNAEQRLGLSFALSAAAKREDVEEEDPRATPMPVSPERFQLARAGILHLSPIVGQLVALWIGPENDEYGILRPTQEAFDTAIRLLVDAAIDGHFERRQIPDGRVSTDSEGGVRIEWIRDGASVHLIVPSTKGSVAYVYHEVGGDYATEDATPERLSYWLRAIA